MTIKEARNAKPDHFDASFEHCLKCKFTKKQAIIMAQNFSKKGFTDASEGCMHYVLCLSIRD